MNKQELIDKVISELDEKMENDYERLRTYHNKDFGMRSRQIVCLIEYLVDKGVIRD